MAELSDQHLLAEARELPRIFKIAYKNPDIKNIPTEYKMGTGHVIFFKDKLQFISNRYRELIKELKSRMINWRFDNSEQFLFGWQVEFTNAGLGHLYNDWCPTEEEIKISSDRIQEKLDNPPRAGFYTWNKNDKQI